MSMYPLAHDKLGNVIEVPERAVSWRVRRVTGLKGRPGFVYGPDGAPLAVPLDATAEDLRAGGCGAGTYKLDALDEAGRPVGVAAFTEITVEDDERPSAGPTSGGADTLRVAVESLARTVEALQRSEGPVRVMEAMQRTQAEREKMTGQIMIALVDKLSGRGSAAQAPDLRVAIKQALAVQEAMDDASDRRNQRFLAAEPAAAEDEDDDEDEDDEDEDDESELKKVAKEFLKTAGPVVMPQITAWLLKRIGLTDAQTASVTVAMSKVAVAAMQTTAVRAKARTAVRAVSATPPLRPAAPPPVAPVSDTAPTDAEAPPDPEEPAMTEAAAKAQLETIWAALTPDEQEQTRALLQRLTPEMLDKTVSFVLSLSTDEAVAFLRARLRRGAKRSQDADADVGGAAAPGAPPSEKGDETP